MLPAFCSAEPIAKMWWLKMHHWCVCACACVWERVSEWGREGEAGRRRERRDHSKHTAPMAKPFRFIITLWPVAREAEAQKESDHQPALDQLLEFAPPWCSCSISKGRREEGGKRDAGLLSPCPLDWHRMGTWTVWIQPLTNCWLSTSGKN